MGKGKALGTGDQPFEVIGAKCEKQSVVGEAKGNNRGRSITSKKTLIL